MCQGEKHGGGRYKAVARSGGADELPKGGLRALLLSAEGFSMAILCRQRTLHSQRLQEEMGHAGSMMSPFSYDIKSEEGPCQRESHL